MYKLFQGNYENFRANPTVFGWVCLIVGKMTARESHSAQGRCRTDRGNFCKVHLFEYECIGLCHDGRLQYVHVSRSNLDNETDNGNYELVNVLDSIEDTLRFAKFRVKEWVEAQNEKDKKSPKTKGS